MNVLSVDLGTVNTVAVLQVDGQPPRLVASLPSAVFLDEAEGRLIVGPEAIDRARTDPSRFEPQPKRRIDEGTVLLGDTFVSVTNLLGAVLHRVVGHAVGLLDGLPPDELRLTHPDEWNAARCTVLVAAARLSGLTTEPVLIRESVAAAAHFTSSGQHLRPGEAIAVYNLGAATFTCAVLGATDSADGSGATVVLAENGLTDVAGLAIDQALLEYVGRAVSHRDPGHWQRLLRPESVEDRIAQRELRESVRVAKEKLATQQMATVPMPAPFDNVDVMRTELDALIRPNLLRGAELLDRTITAAGLVRENLLGAYLVGGSSRMPLVAKATGEHLELRPISTPEPETAVAFGALEASPNTTATPEDFHPDPIPIGRTRPQFSPVAPPPSVSQPVSMPPSGSQPVSMPPSMSQPVSMPPSGSQPVSMPPSMSQPVANIPSFPNYANYPPSGGFPNYQQQPQQPAPQPAKKSKRVPIIIGVIVAVLVAGGVVGGIFLLGGSSKANACQGGGSADGQGFTPCMRQLAGAVPQHAQCAPGTGGVVGIGASGSSVTCTMGSYRVIYQQGGSANSAQSIIETLLPPEPHSLVKANWSGNSLSGQYEAAVVGQDGVLVFSVDNSNTIGVLTTHGSSDLTPDQVADYFEANVQPGS